VSKTSPQKTGKNRSHTPKDFRRRLVFGGLSLILLAGILIGFASTAIVVRQLLTDLDRELISTSNRVAASLENDSGLFPGPRSRLERPGFTVGTVIAVVGDDQAQGAVIDSEGVLRAIEPLALRQLVGQEFTPGEPSTYFLGGVVRETRLIAVQSTGDADLVVGLQMTNIRHTIAQLQGAIFVITAIVIGLAALLGIWALRVGLRPLDRMRHTALAVAGQPLDRGHVDLSQRVPADLARPDREIGQLGVAINQMLDHVGDALKAREHSEKALRQFVSDASHELRTPLASIRGYSEITLRHTKDLPEAVGGSLERIESESIRMTELVEDLLLLARLDEGATFPKEALDLALVAGDVVSDAIARAPGHHWELESPDHPVVVWANRNQLFQVLTNLVQNARVHTPEGTTVKVSVGIDDDHAVVDVVDDGPGINPDMISQLFERFRRGDYGRSRKTGSTGLGLAIVKTITDACGGSVDVSSTPGHTQFHVRLPLARDDVGSSQED
jgi:two-component system, OmpR family, sensor kinase